MLIVLLIEDTKVIWNCKTKQNKTTKTIIKQKEPTNICKHSILLSLFNFLSRWGAVKLQWKQQSGRIETVHICGLCNSGFFQALSRSVGKFYNRLSIFRLILNFQENEKIAIFQTFPDVCHSVHCHYIALFQWYTAKCCDAIKDNQISDSFYWSLLCNDSCMWS